MKTQKNKTGIVKKMREIRDKMSLEIIDTSVSEQQEFIKND
jgi:hypothetical protein